MAGIIYCHFVLCQGATPISSLSLNNEELQEKQTVINQALLACFFHIETNISKIFSI
jgi:hypothetical protein